MFIAPIHFQNLSPICIYASYQSSYHTPQPGMPTVWIILITTWAMKTKKKAIKLNELSVLHGENNKRQKLCESAYIGIHVQCVQWRTGLLEGLVDGPEPAHVRAGGEEDEPQEGHAEVGRPTTSAHPRQTADQINNQCGSIHCKHHRNMTGKMVYGRHPTGCITYNSAGLLKVNPQRRKRSRQPWSKQSDFCLALIFSPVFDQRSILVIAQDASYGEKLANAPRNGQRDYSVKKFVLLNPPY